MPAVLISSVAAGALLELEGVGDLATRALGGGAHALAAAIELAGRLVAASRTQAKRMV